MMDSVSAQVETGSIKLISQIYLLLSRFFSYPGEGLYESMKDTQVQEDLRTLVKGLPFEVNFKGIPSPSFPHDEFESNYINTFDITPTCPLYESSYPREDMTGRDIYEEILRYYEHFDIRLDESERDYPDHLVAELDFMAFLAKKESEAIENGKNPQPYRLAQIDFLERHLKKWIPLLCERLNQRVNEPFYQKTGDLLRNLIDSHYIFLKTTMGS
jgi:DMSO reductase family type II enzyme chaperone